MSSLLDLLNLKFLLFISFSFIFPIVFVLSPLLFYFSYLFFIDFLDLSLTIQISNFSFLFLVSVIFISLMVMLWSTYYMGGSMSMLFFYFFLMLFVLSMLFLVLSDSLLAVFLGWEGLGLTSFLLVIFYQNWASYSGGLLTMLTNRLGDGVLMVSLSYWVLQDLIFEEFQMSGFLLFTLFIVVSFTKSAQVPFTSWLPAAMAAPTPVSALVHSSTLVTAGVWLMIRFSQALLFVFFVWLLFGLLTLVVASLAAMKEPDGKKIVALSTLSQLGLMFISLSLGGSLVCLMHVIMHAFAKANLFMNVGSILHFRFSQQDARYLSSGSEEAGLIASMVVSVVSLSGVSFYSGFYSKECILMGEVTLLSSSMVFFLLMGIVMLTLSYCVMMMSLFLMKSFSYLNFLLSKSFFYKTPIMVMAGFTVVVGYFFWWNSFSFFVFMNGISGLYWMFLVLFTLVLGFNYSFWLSLFYKQKMLVVFFSYGWIFLFKKMNHTLSSLVEPFYLVLSLSSGSFLLSQLMRLVLLIFFSIIIFLLF